MTCCKLRLEGDQGEPAFSQGGSLSWLQRTAEAKPKKHWYRAEVKTEVNGYGWDLNEQRRVFKCKYYSSQQTCHGVAAEAFTVLFSNLCYPHSKSPHSIIPPLPAAD